MIFEKDLPPAGPFCCLSADIPRLFHEYHRTNHIHKEVMPVEHILAALPPRLRENLSADLTASEFRTLEELRFHPNAPVILRFASEERVLPGGDVLSGELELMVELASRASLHTVLPQLRQGFLTLRGGHRLGICGSVRLRDGQIHAIDPLSALNLRLARQVRGAGERLIPRLCPGGRFRSTLILAPPGAGKTTLLRDVVRCLSDGVGCRPHRVSLADERGEVAALYRGRPQLDVGVRTDVMEGCPKAQALMLLLRGMNPQVLCADEITSPEDVKAMACAAGCGVELLCTAHGWERTDLERRGLYRDLMEQGIFHSLVTIRMDGNRRRYEVEDLT